MEFRNFQLELRKKKMKYSQSQNEDLVQYVRGKKKILPSNGVQSN